MPRVSQEHRDQRREQILNAATRCMAREGFHRTSMATIIAESGLSAGAIYGYFKSKNEIIAAIAHRAVQHVRATFVPFLEAPEPVPLSDVVATVLDQVTAFQESGAVDVGRIAVQAWSEALRDESVREIVGERYREVRRDLAEITARAQSAGYVDPEADPAVVAQVVYSLFPGFIMQRLVLGDVDPKAWGDALRGLGVD
jgi:AcrR family transcriptional regulator